MRWTFARPMPVPSNSVLAVQALKHAEEFAGILRIKTRAVVANENHRFAFATGSATDFDFGLGASAGELDGIGNQIDQRHAQQGTVRPHRWQRVDFPDNVSLLRVA